MAFRLDGKRALVTGASRGIGRGIALALAEAGADVAIGYRRERERAEAVVKEIEARGVRGAAFAADVRDGAAVHAMVEHDDVRGLEATLAAHAYERRITGAGTNDVDTGRIHDSCR